MHRRITVQQCKEARGLLKWNQRELSIRADVKLEQLIAFERGEVTLFKGESENIWDAFLKAGIEVDDKGKLTLVRIKRAQPLDEKQSHEIHEMIVDVAVSPVPVEQDPYAIALWQQQMYHEAMLRQQQMMMSPQGVMPVVQEEKKNDGLS